MNRLGPDYWKRVQHEVMLRLLVTAGSLRDEANEGGYKYGEVRVSPDLAAAMAEVNMAEPQMPPMEGM